LKSPSENSGIHWDSISQSGSSLGSVGVHSLTLSYTLGSMKCDSQASLLAHTFASICFDHKPKARVVIIVFQESVLLVIEETLGNNQFIIFENV